MKKIFFLLFFIMLFSRALCADYEGHWAQDEIEFAVSNQFAAGESEDAFLPDKPVTRAEFTALIVRYQSFFSASFSCSMKDADKNAWYYPYLVIAESNHIIFGDNGYFYPNQSLTREDALVMLCRAYSINPPSLVSAGAYSDFSEVSGYAKNAVAFSLNQKILSGYRDFTIRPKQPLTRAEAIVLLNRFYNNASGFATRPDFFRDYPRIANEGILGSVNLALKTNVPCTVYYKAVPTSAFESNLSPNPDSFTQILTTVTDPKTECFATVQLASEEEYNLYFIAVTPSGIKSKVKKISTVKPFVYSEGNGTEENPYLISDEKQLDYIRYFQNKHFRLKNDIQLSENWTPINAENGFFGSIDGNGHTISGLKMKSSEEGCGLFSYLSDGVIKNLTITGDVEGKNNVGLFAGIMKNSTISSCAGIGFVKASQNQAGGLVGTNYGRIENSLSALYTVSSTSYAGGICGINYGTITNNLSAAYAVYSDMYAGGISGANIGGDVLSNVSASFITQDLLTYRSGIITTNKESGKTHNNFSYHLTRKNSKDVFSDENDIDGESVSWDDLRDRNFYTKRLSWSFASGWKMDQTSDGFLLPYPKCFQKIIQTPGLVPYTPKKITNEQELRQMNPNMHYILSNSITLTDEWTPLFDTDTPEDGFSGTFDGNGCTISGLRISHSGDQKKYGLFGMIGDGTVKNLNLSEIHLSGGEMIGSLAAVSYGRIENCSVSAAVLSAESSTESTSLGGLCGRNYGTVLNVQVNADLSAGIESSNIGGITGQNEGFLEQTYYFGKIYVKNHAEPSTTAAGGICGFQSGGYLYNSAVLTDIRTEIKNSYAGGICGIQNGGEIYKTASSGSLQTVAPDQTSFSYAGGITGLSVSGLLVHSFSVMPVTTYSNTSYTGGICGYNESCSLQNTYAANAVVQKETTGKSELYAGGICGFDKTGFLTGSVALNTQISTGGISAKICPKTGEGYLFDNYSKKELFVTLSDPEKNGTETAQKFLNQKSFFLLPVDRGGGLGWPSKEYNGENGIWTERSQSKYPVLNGVKYQDSF